MIKTIALNRLVASPRNVRRTTEPAANLELKADIEARGLLQNLVVTSVRKPKGCFAVEAGERRRQALLALVAEGKIAKDHQVCCLVIDLDEAIEASLAENVQRLAMNPADECLAFSRLVETGVEPHAIARRFGQTVRFVEGRLRLASLAPVVLEALGSGEISLDVAKAYAATADTERQAYVFDQVSRSYMANHPDTIRRMMTQATVGGDDRRALFVGEEAYVEAGGRIERDLFDDVEDARWLDVALLERLASEKLEQLASATEAEQGLAFVRPTLDSWVGYPLTEGLRRVKLETAPLTDEETARVEALESEIGALVDALDNDDLGDAERGDGEARIRALDLEIDSITAKPPVLDETVKGTLGTFLMLDRQGRAVLDSSFYAEADPEPAAPEDCGGSNAPVSAGPTESPRRAAGLPRGLADELAIQRRDILAVHVAADPAFALDLAAFLMVDRESVHAFGDSGSTLSAPRPSDPIFGFRTPDARATLAASDNDASLDRSWMEGATHAERFDAFRALPEAARAAWLGHSIARTLQASTGLEEQRPCAFHDHLGQLLGIDVAAWWRPTGANYFDRVPKAQALAALSDVGGPALAAPYAKAKKAELAAACERIFAGESIAEVGVKQRALAWVPPAMRFAPPPGEDVAADSGDDERGAEDEGIDPALAPIEIGEAA